MNHIAIDLGGTKSQICVRGPDGSIVQEKPHPTARLGRWLKRQPRSRAILEMSAEAFGAPPGAVLRAANEVVP
jgi:hypothetical protein